MLKLWILSAWGTLLMSQQPIIFHAPPDTGLAIIPASDPGYEAALQPFFANPRSNLGTFGGVLRACSLIVRNTSGQDIRLITLRWVQTVGSRTLSDQTAFRFVRDFVQPTLHQGESTLLFPRQAVFGNNVAVAEKSLQLDNYRTASRIDVYLDAVVYADWHLIGPDAAGSSVMLAAQRQAILDTQNDVSQQIAAGRSTTAFAETLYQLRPAPTSAVPDQLRDYGYQYAQTRRALGSFLLHSGTDARSHLLFLQGLVGRLQ